MIADDSYEVPFETDTDEFMEVADAHADFPTEVDDDLRDAKQAWDPRDMTATEFSAAETAQGDADDMAASSRDVADDPVVVELAEPFVGQWNQLISTTNWEKGRIISEWRAAIIASGVDATHYSDEAWAQRVGGVTAPHVGRLRRVHDRFGATYATYQGIYWSHFLAAIDWEDAPLWLEGASRESWSVSQMREMRWQSHGAVDSQRPTASQVVEVDLDEDIVLPAQGGGRMKSYDDEPGGVASGPIPEGPDFGEEESLTSFEGGKASGARSDDETSDAARPPVQPFAGLPPLPPDLADAVESFKLAVLRHKTGGWEKVSSDTVNRYLDALAILLTA